MSKRVQKTVTGLLIAALCVGSLAGTSDKSEAKKKASIKKKNITIVKGKSKKITIKNKKKKCRYSTSLANLPDIIPRLHKKHFSTRHAAFNHFGNTGYMCEVFIKVRR
mgnify:CR=1 FL=1